MKISGNKLVNSSIKNVTIDDDRDIIGNELENSHIEDITVLKGGKNGKINNFVDKYWWITVLISIMSIILIFSMN